MDVTGDTIENQARGGWVTSGMKDSSFKEAIVLDLSCTHADLVALASLLQTLIQRILVSVEMGLLFPSIEITEV